MTSTPPPKLNKLTECKNQIFAASIATLGSFGTGTVFGWSAVVTKTIKEDFSEGKDISAKISWVTSLAILGAFFGGPLAGLTMNYLGRKSAMLLFTLPFVIGWITICSAEGFKPDGFFLLYIGRLITGMCAGSYLVIIPTYIKEVSSDSMRGILGAAVPLMLVTGILYVFIIGAMCDWFVLTIICCAPPIFLALGTFFIPETPRFLIVKKKKEKAVSAFKWLTRNKSYETAHEQLMQIFSVEAMSSPKDSSKTGRLFSRPVLHPIIIIVIVTFFQQFGGVNAVTLYTDVIFEKAAGKSKSFIEPKIAIILIGIVQVVFVLAAMFLVDVLGRKTLLIYGSFVMSLSLVGLGTFFYLKEKNDGSDEPIMWLPVITVCTYMAAYSCGVGSVPWVLASEIYNPNYRAESASVMTSAYWIFGFIVAKIFDDLNKAMRESGSFWLYGGFCLAGSIFAALFVPETKGKTSEEILEYFGGGKHSSYIVAENDNDAGRTIAIEPTMEAIVVVDSHLYLKPQKENVAAEDEMVTVTGDQLTANADVVNNKHDENEQEI